MTLETLPSPYVKTIKNPISSREEITIFVDGEPPTTGKYLGRWLGRSLGARSSKKRRLEQEAIYSYIGNLWQDVIFE